MGQAVSGKVRLPSRIPVAIREGKLEAWGWIQELTPKRIRLLTSWDWEAGTQAELEFELNGQTFKMTLRALSSDPDADGYHVVDAGVLSLADSEKLAAALLPLLAARP
jgi:hypothetical protein